VAPHRRSHGTYLTCAVRECTRDKPFISHMTLQSSPHLHVSLSMSDGLVCVVNNTHTRHRHHSTTIWRTSVETMMTDLRTRGSARQRVFSLHPRLFDEAAWRRSDQMHILTLGMHGGRTIQTPHTVHMCSHSIRVSLTGLRGEDPIRCT
jgi:hypothetical protein